MLNKSCWQSCLYNTWLPWATTFFFDINKRKNQTYNFLDKETKAVIFILKYDKYGTVLMWFALSLSRLECDMPPFWPCVVHFHLIMLPYMLISMFSQGYEVNPLAPVMVIHHLVQSSIFNVFNPCVLRQNANVDITQKCDMGTIGKLLNM